MQPITECREVIITHYPILFKHVTRLSNGESSVNICNRSLRRSQSPEPQSRNRLWIVLQIGLVSLLIVSLPFENVSRHLF